MTSQHVLLSADYKQIEARLVAWYAAGKPATLEKIPPGANFLRAFLDPQRDPYVETAAVNTGKHAYPTLGAGTPDRIVTKDDRQRMGKVPCLASLYDISWKGLQHYAWKEYQLVWSDEQAKNIHHNFYHVSWPDVRRWIDTEKTALTHRGYAFSALGRLRRLPEIASSDPKVREEGLKSGLNFPIQSLAQDLTQTAAALLCERYVVDKYARLVGFVHDALLIEVLAEDASMWEAWLWNTMTNLAPEFLRRQFGFTILPGLIQVDIHVGPWGSQQTVEEWRRP